MSIITSTNDTWIDKTFKSSSFDISEADDADMSCTEGLILIKSAALFAQLCELSATTVIEPLGNDFSKRSTSEVDLPIKF